VTTADGRLHYFHSTLMLPDQPKFQKNSVSFDASRSAFTREGLKALSVVPSGQS